MKKVLIVVSIVLLSFPIGMRLAGETSSSTPLGEVSFSFAPHIDGVGEAYVPLTDWGVRIDLFDVPLRVAAEPRAIDRENLLRVAGGDTELLQASVSALDRALVLAGAKTLLFVFLVALFLAFAAKAIFSLNKKFLLEVAWGTLAGLLFLSLAAFLTYSPEKIENPTFYAKGAELSQLIGAVDRERRESEGSYSSNFDRILRGMSSYLTSTGSVEAEGEALVMSDLHSNALVLSSLEDFAGQSPVFFVGDFAHQGNDAEATLLAERVASLGRPVFAVSGNHDSETLMLELAKRGVVVLGEEGVLLADGSWKKKAYRTEGMLVAGYRDPLEWRGPYPDDPKRIFSFGELDDDAFSQASQDLLSWWEGMDKKPDVLLLHQNGLADFLAKKIQERPKPTYIITGHNHKPSLTRIGSATIINAGAAGAGGILGAGAEEAEIAKIHFANKKIETVDMISVDPLRGSALAERVILGDLCGGELPCTYRPRFGQDIRIEK